MGKMLLTIILCIVSPIFLVSIILILSLSYFHSGTQSNQTLPIKTSPTQVLASVPGPSEIEENIDIAVDRYLSDPRITGLRNFFAYYKSPLTPYAEDVVIVSDVYGIDYRLIPAIAMQESTLCKKAPKHTNNCWGFGIYGKKKTSFASYLDGIHIVSKTLATRYIQKGLTTPDEIMTKYTPSNRGEWAQNVKDFMAKIDQMTPSTQDMSSLAEKHRVLTQPEKELEINRRSLTFAL